MEPSSQQRTLLEIQDQNAMTSFKMLIRQVSRLERMAPEQLSEVHGWNVFKETPKMKQYLEEEGVVSKTYRIEEVVREDNADLLHTCMNLLITQPEIIKYIETRCPEWQWLLMYIDYRIAKKNAKVFPVMLLDNPDTSKKEDPKTSNNKMGRQVCEMAARDMNQMRRLLAELKTIQG
jgi:hypothetical protein